MINMKKFLKRIWEYIKDLYEGLIRTTKKYVPLAIKIVDSIKKVMDSPVDDIILGIISNTIPGETDDKLIAKVKAVVEEWVPKILLELKIVESISNIEGTNAQLQAILDELKKLSPETQAIVWHGLASLILEKLSDGELSWADSVAIAEYYYQNIHNKK